MMRDHAIKRAKNNLSRVLLCTEPEEGAMMMILGFAGLGFLAYRRTNWMALNAA